MIHPTAYVHPSATVGEGTQIWRDVQVREGAKIGKNCRLGKGVYIGVGVEIGDCCKIQNYACLFTGVVLGNGVFIGPHVCFTNDKYPRATTSDGKLRENADWVEVLTIVEDGASIGANATILPGIVIGKRSMIGAGSVVTENTCPDFLYVGNPAIPKGIAHG